MMEQRAPSAHLIFSDGIWKSTGDFHPSTEIPSTEIKEEIDRVFAGQAYSCIPAMLSYQSHEYMVGSYQDFGRGQFAKSLYQDLRYFAEVQKRTQSLYMSFWAVFMDATPMNEAEFEDRMWKEISTLCAAEEPNVPWDPRFSANPADPNFCPSIGGEAFFIVGMHPGTSRMARKFKWPAIVFNLYEQFEELDRQGRYQSIVRRNRDRDVKLQGSVNPMVEKYGDKWESIQFSGRENPPNWKCPFHRADGP